MNEIIHALVPIVVFACPTAVAVAFGWFRHRERMASLHAASAPAHAAVLEVRLARLEHVVEATGVEVERMGEGQRFVTRLLAERAPAALHEQGPAPRRALVTPH